MLTAAGAAPGSLAPGNDTSGFCSACFTGAYPVPITGAQAAASSLVPLRRLTAPRS